MMDGLVASARDASLNLPNFRYHSIVAPWLRAVEPARRVGAVAGAGGECEARELQPRVLTGEEAAPHTPELRDEHRAVAEGGWAPWRWQRHT